MGKNKLSRFADNERFEHVIQPLYVDLEAGRFKLKGEWNKAYFKRDAPLILELGCGKGEYSTGLAKLHPENNYVGVDIKGARIWRGAKTAHEEELNNVAFVRARIDMITECFAPNEVDGIWLTFSDPQRLKPRKRLTSSRFTERYRRILKPGAPINLKTDSELLYEYTMEQIAEHGHVLHESSADVYGELVQRSDETMQHVLNIRTFYEDIWLKQGSKIHYVRFSLSPENGDNGQT